ncbi:MAG: hypothetical protein ABFQ53_03795 [Patescibacteria group bacterium]
MQIEKRKVFITICDMCKSTITPVRINGFESYEKYGYSVCSGCCAKPQNSIDSLSKKKFLAEFYHASKKLKNGIPPFWPTDDSGNALDLSDLIYDKVLV